MAKLYTTQARDAGSIRDSFLRTIRNGLIQRGISNPNTTPGSDYYLLGQAVGNELQVVEANSVMGVDSVLPDTADENELPRIADIYDTRLQPAAGAIGTGILTCSATTTIQSGSQLLDGAGLRYQLSVGGTFNNGDTLSIEAIDTGAATNHEEGDVLRWQSAPPFADEKVLVGPGGLFNGHDAEDIEGMRTRLLARLQTPPGTGNWEHAIEIAEKSSPAVQKAFCMPAIQGPSTMHLAVTAAPTATNKNRDIAKATLDGTITPYVLGQLPSPYTIVSTVRNVNADIAFAISIPESPTASPPGPGGGWTNGTPWPSVDAVSVWRVTVTNVMSTTHFVVDAETAPVKNVTRIAWLSPYEWKLYTATVTNIDSGIPGAYEIEIDQPFVGLTTGCYIWPEAKNGQAYVDAVIDAFRLMGPGEKTTNVSALIRGYRHPRPETAYPYSLGPHLPNVITRAQAEVATAQFLHRTDGTTTLLDATRRLVPQVPNVVTDPPNIFVPHHIAFYRLP